MQNSVSQLSVPASHLCSSLNISAFAEVATVPHSVCVLLEPSIHALACLFTYIYKHTVCARVCLHIHKYTNLFLYTVKEWNVKDFVSYKGKMP